MNFQALRTAALQLEPKLRARLAHELLADLDTMSQEENQRLWIEEAIRRDDEIDAGIAETRPAEAVFAAAKASRQ